MGSLREVRPGRRLWVVEHAGDPDLPALYFIHGAMARHDQYEYQISHFRALNHTIVAYDYYGCGKSEMNDIPSAYHTDEHVSDALVLFDITLGRCKSVIVIGHSFGTNLALSLSGRRDNVAGVVCLGPGRMPTDGGPAFLRYAPVWLLNMLHSKLSAGFLQRAFHAQTLEKKTEHHARVVADAIASNGKNSMFVVQHFYDGLTWTPQRDIKHAAKQAPVLLLAGEDDKIFPSSPIAEAFRDTLLAEGAITTLHVIPQTGHQLHMESPDAVNAHIVAFIKQL